MRSPPDIYASAPLKRLRDDQTRALLPELQRCAGDHALMLSASADDLPPVLPLLGFWTRLWVSRDCYQGDLLAATDTPLPFCDDAFQLVLIRHAQEVVPQASLLLAEAVRVLEPGGTLVLAGVHPISGWTPWLQWRARHAPPVMHLPLRLRQILRRAGLQIVRGWRVGGLLPHETALSGINIKACGGGYVLLARKQRLAVIPLRSRRASISHAANARLSPSVRRSATL